MRREMIVSKNRVFGEYGKVRLMNYSESFRNLAKTFLDIPKPDTDMVLAGAELECASPEERQRIWEERRREQNRTMLAEHLFDMADIMNDVACETEERIYVEERLQRRICRELRSKGILMTDLLLMRDIRGYHRLVVSMRAAEKDAMIPLAGINDYLSTYLNIRWKTSKGSITMLNHDEQSVIYEEEARYYVKTGAATAVKEGERLSGDNYMVMDEKNGLVYAALADGAGSGERANRASKMVVELMERFLEAGFDQEAAIQMINGVLLASEEEAELSTLDLCRIDCYTGVCEFNKVGSCNSYIKSDDLLEVVMAGNLPLGVFYRVEVERTETQLCSGDYVILLSDGIVEGLGGRDHMGEFEELLRRIRYQDPTELANFLLNYVLHVTQGRVRDDMSVLVLGIWENGLQFD